MHSICGSQPCTKSELDLFYSLPTNTSILSSFYTKIPIAKINGDEEKFNITIPGTDHYTDLSDIYVKLEVTIKNSTGVITNASKIGPINNFGHSLFKKVELKVGLDLHTFLVELGSTHYAYKAYILNLINFGSEAKNTWLDSCIYHKDTASEFDNHAIEPSTTKKIKYEGETTASDINIPNTVNNGFIKRRQKFLTSKGKVSMIFPLHCDIFHSNRFLLNKIGLEFEFERNNNTFLLMGDDTDYSVHINKFEIYARQCQINDSVKLAHVTAMQLSPAIYPFKHKKVAFTNLSANSRNYMFNNFGSIIPSKMIFGLIKDESYNGTFKSNPFNFLPQGLSIVRLTVENVPITIKIDADQNDFSEAYHLFCEGLNIYGRDGNDISIEEFANGNCLFFFNLLPDKGYCEQYNLIKTGSIILELEFAKPLTNGLKLMAFMEYDNQMNIDKKYDITFDHPL